MFTVGSSSGNQKSGWPDARIGRTRVTERAEPSGCSTSNTVEKKNVILIEFLIHDMCISLTPVLKKLIKIIDKPIPYPSLRLPFTMLYK
jgi:hypothetical protein